MSKRHALHDPVAGARNLLLGCAGVAAGDNVLLIVEPAGSDHYSPAVAQFIAEQVRELGASVDVMAVAPASGPEDVPASMLAAIGEASHTIFLNRTGDQLRFSPLPGIGSKTMSYTLDMEFLGSAFAVTPYRVWEGILASLVRQLDAADRYAIRCPRGTDLSMQVDRAQGAARRNNGFTVKSFPLMIEPPIPAHRLSGKLVLSQALTSTYLHHYDDSVLPLATPLCLTIENGTIVRIEGERNLVRRAEAQFERVAGMFGGNRWALNSWHAGINAFTFFPRPALSDIDRWSCVAFGSPRYAHFHMCGPGTGDICGQIFDPTISFDGTAMWENGFAAFLTPDDKRRLVETCAVSLDAFDTHREIGVG